MAEERDPATLKQIIKLMREQGLLESKSFTAIQSKIAALQQERDITNDLQRITELNFQTKQQENQLYQSLLDTQLRALEGVRNIGEAEAQRLRTLSEAVRVTRDQSSAIRNLDQRAQTLLKTFTGIDHSIKDSLVYGVASVDGGLKKLGTTAMTSLSSLNLIGSTYQKMIEGSLVLFRQVDQLNAALVKETGLINQQAGDLERNWRAMGALGTSIGQTREAMAGLNRNTASFNTMSQTQRDQLIRLTAQLGQAGAQIQDVTQTLNLLVNGFGMGTSQIEAMFERLNTMSQTIGVPLGQVSADFAAFAREGAKYGRRMEKVFEDLLQQSKVTGIGMQQLLGVAKQFDTFNSAAEAVGRLNALLGGPYLSAIDMLYATEAQRVQKLREMITVTGQSWSAMNRFEQQAIASAAGINDMSQAAQLFGASASEYNKVLQKQRDIAQLAEASRGTIDRLKEAFMKITVAMDPFVGALGFVADHLEKIVPKGKGAASMIGGLLFASVVKMGLAARNTAMAIQQTATGIAQLVAAAGNASAQAGAHATAMQAETSSAAGLTGTLARLTAGERQLAAATRQRAAAQRQGGIIINPATGMPFPRPQAAAPPVAARGGAMPAAAAKSFKGSALMILATLVAGPITKKIAEAFGAEKKKAARLGALATGAAAGAATGYMFGGGIGAGVGGAVGAAAGYYGGYAKGGNIPGPRGAPRPIVAHGGEAVVPNRVGDSMSGLQQAMERNSGLLASLIEESKSRKSSRPIMVYLDKDKVGEGVADHLNGGLNMGIG